MGKKYLSSKSTNFCSVYLDYAKEKRSLTRKAADKPERAVTTKKVADKIESVLKVVKLIKNGTITNDDEMNLLCQTIGEPIGKNISTRIQNVRPKPIIIIEMIQ